MFYHLTLNKPSGISLCVPGCFTSSERHSEFLLLRGPRILELWILHPNGIKCVSKQEFCGEILSMKPLRPPGAERDYLVASTKEGDTFILIYDFRHRAFIKVYSHSIQAHRSSQLVGHFVATDPRGRAFIMGAKENIKAVYSVNMVDQYNLNVSFIPFDEKVLYKGLTYDIVFLYDTFDNNIVSFATTEIVFQDSIPYNEKRYSHENFERLTKQQSLNFFDINLKTRKVKLRESEFLKHKSNFLMEVPGGNIGPGGILIFSLNNVVYKRGEFSARCPIPRRFDESTEGLQKPMIFINCTLYLNRGSFYYLAQTELGDIFKIMLAQGNPIELQMQYFVCLPLASALYILESDSLFVAYESGDHALYSIAGISLCAEPVFSSILGLKDDETFFFWPKTSIPEHLVVIPSLSPMISMPVIKPCSLFAVCGTYGNYILKGISQKMQVCSAAEIKVDDCLQKKVIAVKDLNVLWSCLHAVQLRMRDLIILSYAEKTVVFELENGIISQVAVPDIYTSSNTLACRILNNEIVVQITSQGIHTNYPDSKWRSPANKRVAACALNDVQAILLLDDTTLHYVNIGEHARLTIYPDTIKNVQDARCILLSNDTGYADFSLIGTHKDSIFVISLRPDTMLQCVCKIENLIHPITALLSCRIGHQEPEKLKLLVGLANGTLLVTYMDKSNGSIGEIKKYNLGTDPIKMFDCGHMVMILTNYTWLYLLDGRKVVLKRFYAGIIETGCNFREPYKFFLFSHPVLRLVYVADLNPEMQFEPILKITYDPKKMVANHKTRFLFFTQPVENENLEEHNQEDTMESSMLHVFYPFPPTTHFCIELQDAVCCSYAFSNGLDPLMFISSKKASDPRRGGLQMIKLSISEDGKLLVNLLDRIDLEAVPTAMEPFGAGVLIGVGKEMRIIFCNSEMKLYEDCKCLCATTSIASISTNGNNILVRDSEAGLVILKYNVDENKLRVFARDPKPVWLCCFFGPNSIAKTDQFGNITIVQYSRLQENDLSTEEDLREILEFKLNGPKAATMTHFSVGEIVLSMQMASIYLEGQPVLLYSTISGCIGIIALLQCPVFSILNEKLLVQLERFMLLQDPVFCEDHMSFRSPHCSTEKLVNGDLCEQYGNLDPDAQNQFARFIGLSPEEIIFRLVEIRSVYLL